MLGAYVDKELELTRQPDLEKHLAGCPSCQAAAERLLAGSYGMLCLTDAPDGFEEGTAKSSGRNLMIFPDRRL